MRLGWAIAIGVLGGAALAYWLTPAQSRWNPLPTRPGAPADMGHPAGPGDAPVLYRWRDAQGVLHVAGQPPTGGQAYERVEIPQERNIIPMGVAPEGD